MLSAHLLIYFVFFFKSSKMHPNVNTNILGLGLYYLYCIYFLKGNKLSLPYQKKINCRYLYIEKLCLLKQNEM